MFRIIKDNSTLGTVSSPVWVRLQDNGFFALCSEENAQGLVVNNTVYHVAGKPELPNHDTVIVVNINEIDYQRERLAEEERKQLQVDTALVELSILIANNIGG